MNTGLILRWMGGAGGDTLLHMISEHNDVYMNVQLKENIDRSSGKSLVSSKYDSRYPTLFDLSSNEIVDRRKLQNDIQNLSKSHTQFVIKSHFFDKKFDDSIVDLAETVDLGFGLDFLPFVVRSNINKTATLDRSGDAVRSHFDQTLQKISSKLDKEQRKMLVTWNVIKSMIQHIGEFHLESSPISTADLFLDVDRLENFFMKRNLKIDKKSSHLSEWKRINAKLLPSPAYQDHLRNSNYDFNDNSLDLVERYILLALANENFRILS
jgi:hypothetical protein